MAKKPIKETVAVDAPIENSQEVSSIPEKEVVWIILFASSKMVKEDTEKRVSGNIANALINKGFAKLKN